MVYILYFVFMISGDPHVFMSMYDNRSDCAEARKAVDMLPGIVRAHCVLAADDW